MRDDAAECILHGFCEAAQRPRASGSGRLRRCSAEEWQYLWIGADPVESLTVADAPFARSRRQMPSVRALLACMVVLTAQHSRQSSTLVQNSRRKTFKRGPLSSSDLLDEPRCVDGPVGR